MEAAGCSRPPLVVRGPVVRERGTEPAREGGIVEVRVEQRVELPFARDLERSGEAREQARLSCGDPGARERGGLGEQARESRADPREPSPR